MANPAGEGDTELLIRLGLTSRSTEALLERYGCLAAVLSGEPSKLVALVGEEAAGRLLDVRQACLSMLRRGIEQRPLIGSPSALVEYLHAQLAWRRREAIHILLLDAGNRLLHDETVGVGSAAEAPIRPREIIGMALQFEASAMIIAHNHPGGDPKPSPSDVGSTQQLWSTARTLGIVLRDHLIITTTGFTSMAMLGMLGGDEA